MKVIAVYLAGAPAPQAAVAVSPASTSTETETCIREFVVRVHPGRSYETREEGVKAVDASTFH